MTWQAWSHWITNQEQEKPRSHQGPPHNLRNCSTRSLRQRGWRGPTGCAGVYFGRGWVPHSPPPLWAGVRLSLTEPWQRAKRRVCRLEDLRLSWGWGPLGYTAETRGLNTCLQASAGSPLPQPSFPTRACVLSRFSRVWLSVALWTVARQAPLSVGFSRQECWGGLPGPPPGAPPNPRIKPAPPSSIPLAPPGKWWWELSHKFQANWRSGQCPVGKWHHGPSLENLTSPKEREVKIPTPGAPRGPPSSAHREFHTNKYTQTSHQLECPTLSYDQTLRDCQHSRKTHHKRQRPSKNKATPKTQENLHGENFFERPVTSSKSSEDMWQAPKNVIF